MLQSFLIGIGGIVGLMLVWAIVQVLWGRVFAEYRSDEDVLADRRSCGNCGCATTCRKRQEEEHLPQKI